MRFFLLICALIILLLSCERKRKPSNELVLKKNLENQVVKKLNTDLFKISIKDTENLVSEIYTVLNLPESDRVKCTKSDGFNIYLFKNKKTYLFVSAKEVPSYYQWAIYEVNNNSFQQKKSFQYDNEGFYNDTIIDVNGDLDFDIVLKKYSPSGCCLRENHLVWLSNKKERKFLNRYEFMNPIFNPLTQTILGITYGHCGESPLYKLKWDGSEIDTIEYIINDPESNGFFISDNYKSEDVYNNSETTFISDLPEEYLQIENLDWFFGCK